VVLYLAEFKSEYRAHLAQAADLCAAIGRQLSGVHRTCRPRSPMHHGAGCRGGPQRSVSGDILTTWPILRGMAKRSSHRQSASPQVLSSAGRTQS
jgi:hypothetical protein